MISSKTITIFSIGCLLCSLVYALSTEDMDAPVHVHASPHAETTESISFLVEVMNSIAIVFLVAMAAIFSGLTLGLMSLDKTGLEVIIGAGEAHGAAPDEAWKAVLARRILPIRNNGNLLLTTLILGNVAVNSLLSIFMADLTSGLTGFLISTVTIVICGEIIPQAICSRHALAVGAKLVPLVRVLIMLFYFAGKPVSVALDYALGADVGTIFTKRELQKLLEIHVKQKALHPHEGHIVRGAMSYRQKRVSSIMVPVHQMFSLPATTVLNIETIKTIYQSGFSRIPVWDKDQNDIMGIFFVKDLVLINPKENIPVADLVQAFDREIHRVCSDTKLGDVLSGFKSGHSHMALVYDVNKEGDPVKELKGMITLSDIVEEILQAKISDETGSRSVKQRQERRINLNRMVIDYV